MVFICKFLSYLYEIKHMADVASYHGGDGGGDDPIDPSRILASCESGINFLKTFNFFCNILIVILLI